MTSTLPDGTALPGTRAELLIQQREQVTRVEREYFSALRVLKAAGWLVLLVFGVAVAATFLEERRSPSTGTFVAVYAGVGITAIVVLWRLLAHAGHGRQLKAELHQWHDVDRTRESRALPQGNIDPDVATMFDIRDQADFATACRDVSFSKQMRITELRLLWPSLVASPGIAGLAAFISAFTVDGLALSVRLAYALVGLMVFVPAATVVWSMVAEGWRRQQDFNLCGVERRLYWARRSAQSGEEPEVVRLPPPWALPLVVTILVCLLGLVFVRIALASPLARNIVVVIVALGIGAVAIATIRRRPLRVIPLLVGGGTVLDKPGHRIELDASADGLRLGALNDSVEGCAIGTDQILGIVAVKIRYPFAPEAVGVLTGQTPIILAGRRVGSHPAIEKLRPLIQRWP